MARREYVSREERSRARSHRACRSWKEKLLFHSKQQELKKLPGTILSCLQTLEEPLYKNPLNLPTHPQNIFLSAPKQSPWNGKSLAPDEINFSIVFKYQLFPLESQFRYLLVPKKNCQSSSFIIVYIVYNMQTMTMIQPKLVLMDVDGFLKVSTYTCPIVPFISLQRPGSCSRRCQTLQQSAAGESI